MAQLRDVSLDSKGKILENNIYIFNDGSATYLHPGSGTYSALDLSLSDPDIHNEFEWLAHDDLCGSDQTYKSDWRPTRNKVEF